ncbi:MULTISPECIES: molybdopterin-binding protein [Rhizobium]|uniref:molybdopterin-binding protein n=1 Tax=Rhizobium TaxID=379 RepID=UPI0013B7B5A1|nr:MULTISPECIES: molybdopterin-binding protein [Rhizobium]MBY3321486.1 molybdopterin-dependent oxidoreductase [Rhizobium laguerreae]MBY3362800.1 molybdopterin-dependent oxidoreductase [Rhizobium laguerreae]MCA2436638.1 molybdopterin-binding protein [Rhizobium leguminosarum]NEH73517.1 molybdopterin-dependent oxidoreductase [Rhizobium leguminosarum]NKM67621.1 molybdopterin-dependent oxidoreductase [Rhizobium laguerreae]
MTSKLLTRRRFLIGSTLGASAITLSSCDLPNQSQSLDRVVASAESVTMRVQRFLQGRNALAREFSEADISPSFRVNGSSSPDSDEYLELSEGNFVNWRLKVDGLVDRPQDFSLADLKALASRTQITRHDCVEGWSAIGKWTGVPLATVLKTVGIRPTARYAVFHCADELEKTLDGSGQYYESIDLIDAFHPQTILAYQMNDKDLSIGHGAPLRLRVERQLGYKQAKYIMRIELVDSFAGFWGGNGGYWEDRGYEWYAGI